MNVHELVAIGRFGDILEVASHQTAESMASLSAAYSTSRQRYGWDEAPVVVMGAYSSYQGATWLEEMGETPWQAPTQADCLLEKGVFDIPEVVEIEGVKAIRSYSLMVDVPQERTGLVRVRLTPELLPSYAVYAALLRWHLASGLLADYEVAEAEEAEARYRDWADGPAEQRDWPKVERALSRIGEQVRSLKANWEAGLK
jgi:hypothetical protein